MRDTRKLVAEWLKDYTWDLLAWTQSHMHCRDAEGTELLTQYVDIDVPEICEAVKLGWTWTLDSPEREDDYSEPRPWFVIEKAYTHIAHFDVRTRFDDVNGANPALAIVPVGSTPTPEQQARLDAVPAEHLIELGGWLPRDVSEAVADWVKHEIGRTFAVIYEEDQPSTLQVSLTADLDDFGPVPHPNTVLATPEEAVAAKAKAVMSGINAFRQLGMNKVASVLRTELAAREAANNN